MIWTILSMVTQKQLDGLTDVVISANWLCADETNTVRQGGDCTFDPPQQSFTPYDQLTESEVLSWVFAQLGDKKTEIELSLQDQLNYIANVPVTILPNPWA